MNAMDFSDLLLNVHEIFERDPGVLLRWQARAEHLLVDEYQDTNRVQYLLVRALSARSRIYAWSATRTSRFTAGAAPTSATSSTSSATFPRRASSSSSRTTAPPRPSWPPPTP